MDLKSLLKSIKLHESTISMILGAVVIVIAGVLMVNYFSGRNGQTIPPIETVENSPLPTTHVVTSGENLWDISEKYYNSGYNWQDIVDANSLQSPDDIKVGQELTIPDVAPKLAGSEITGAPPATVVPTEVPTASPVPQINEGVSVYTVKEGDNLWKIAEAEFKSGYNWVDIARENKLSDPGKIETGQQLSIPSVAAKTATTDQVAGTSTKEPISGATYTVEKGDNLWNIAVRAYGDGYKWVEIARENSLANPGLIFSGNVLTLPR